MARRTTGSPARSTVAAGLGATQVTLGGARRIRDFSDLPVIAPVVNSLLAQEGGKDYGDYVLLQGVTARAAAAAERPHDAGAVGGRRGEPVGRRPGDAGHRELPARTPRWARGPGGWPGSSSSGRAAASRCGGTSRAGSASRAGTGPGDYARATLESRWLTTLAGHELVSRVYLGAGTDGLPPHRSFVLGGRGTLVGEPFRAYGGRDDGAGRSSSGGSRCRCRRFPSGSFASTGRSMTVAPFLAAGVAGRPLPGLPWAGSDGVRPVAGVALEWFMRLIRVEAGVGLRDGGFGLTVDVNRDWWGLL